MGTRGPFTPWVGEGEGEGDGEGSTKFQMLTKRRIQGERPSPSAWAEAAKEETLSLGWLWPPPEEGKNTPHTSER